MDPINYSIDVKSPFEQTVQGFQLGAGIRQQQQAQAQQAQLQADLAKLATNPNASANDYAYMMTRYPQLSEHFKRGWEVRNEGQRQNDLSQASQVYAALQSDKPDVAQQLLTERATALRNSGDEANAKHADIWAQVIGSNPQAAKNSTGLMLASILGPDKFAETFGKLGNEQRAQEQAPTDLRKKTADATTAEAKAKYADSEALLDLQKKGWDITKIQEDIKIAKENNRIAAMNAAISRESNQLKKEELTLKRDEAKEKRDEALRGKVAEVESARMNIDNMLNTADRILQNQSLNNVVGSIEGRIPSVMSDEGADAIAMIETLKSQSFLAQIPNIKGMGALSNAEGEKLQSALQNLDRVQSEKQFKDNVKEAQRLMLKARKNIASRYGVPDTVPDTPAAKPAKGKSTDDILKELGVM
jgi:hypothetical protein